MVAARSRSLGFAALTAAALSGAVEASVHSLGRWHVSCISAPPKGRCCGSKDEPRTSDDT